MNTEVFKLQPTTNEELLKMADTTRKAILSYAFNKWKQLYLKKKISK